MDKRMAKNGTMGCKDCLECPHPWCRCSIGKNTHDILHDHIIRKGLNIKLWGGKFGTEDHEFRGISSVGPPLSLTRQSGRPHYTVGIDDDKVGLLTGGPGRKNKWFYTDSCPPFGPFERPSEQDIRDEEHCYENDYDHSDDNEAGPSHIQRVLIDAEICVGRVMNMVPTFTYGNGTQSANARRLEEAMSAADQAVETANNKINVEGKVVLVIAVERLVSILRTLLSFEKKVGTDGVSLETDIAAHKN